MAIHEGMAREYPLSKPEVSGSRKFDPFGDCRKLRHPHVEGIGKALQSWPARRLGSRLDSGYPGQMMPCKIGQFLLGQACAFSDLADRATNGNLRFRGGWHNVKPMRPEDARL